MTGIIDCHVHLFPPLCAVDPAEWAGPRDEVHWLKLVTSGPQGWSDVTNLLRCMDEAGVERAVLQGWYWQKIQSCSEHNAYMAECVAAHPDRLSFFATTLAHDPGGLSVLEVAFESGACGVGELFPAAQGGALMDPYTATLAEWAAAHSAPVLLHTAEAVAHDYPGRLSVPLEDYVDLARSHPQTIFILAHWGGGLPFFFLNPKVRAGLENLYFDTAASPLLYDERVWSTVLNIVPAERVLFGSDYPLRLYPKYEKTPSMRRFLREAQASITNPRHLAAVLGDNFRSLLF